MNTRLLSKAFIALFVLMGLLFLPCIASAQTDMMAVLFVDWGNEVPFDLDATVQFYNELAQPISLELDLIPNAALTVWALAAPLSDDFQTADFVVFRWDEGNIDWDCAPPFQVDVDLGQGEVELEIMPLP